MRKRQNRRFIDQRLAQILAIGSPRRAWNCRRLRLNSPGLVFVVPASAGGKNDRTQQPAKAGTANRWGDCPAEDKVTQAEI